MLSKLIKNYVEKVIEYEFASREIGEDGHRCSATNERKSAEQAFIDLDNYVNMSLKTLRDS